MGIKDLSTMFKLECNHKTKENVDKKILDCQKKMQVKHWHWPSLAEENSRAQEVIPRTGRWDCVEAKGVFAMQDTASRAQNA